MPARSRPEGFDLTVVALSARALAASAKRAGLRALAIDLFADADTREHAALAVRAPASRRGAGFAQRALLAALETYAPAGLPVVLGAGFEHSPQTMRAIARRNPIIGATPDQVARLKDPFAFAELLAELGVPHPPVAGAATAVATRSPWLSKRIGASGGAHIRRARETAGASRYLQALVAGRSVSALFCADGASARIVGFSEQWSDPTRRAPWRYGGAVGPIELPENLAGGIAAALDRIVAATSLSGLASADLILPEGGDGPPSWLLEINPRPGATLDVFDHEATPSLLGLHLEACAGRLPAGQAPSPRARAAALVYAPRAVVPETIRRPLWTADWPSCDETVPAGAPFCTVLATAGSPSAARALVAERRAALVASLRAAPSPATENQLVPA